MSVLFVTDKAFLSQTEGLVKHASVPITVRTVAAGKFRRYMDIALWKQVLRPDIGGRNMIDMFKVAGGVAQSIRLLKQFKPDVVFAKGGYVSLPVGYAAHVLHVPLVIHDSDVRPGLTNRVLSRWATAIATGMPVKNYRYNAEIADYTGVPVRAEFQPYTEAQRRAAKKKLGHDESRPLIAVTGGGLGAKEINHALVAIGPKLLEAGYEVHHVTGKAAYATLKPQLPESSRYTAVPFVFEGLSEVYGAADLVVTRASATTLQELAAAATPAVIVPNSSLGDQLENARVYETDGAVLMLEDEQLTETPEVLYQIVHELLQNTAKKIALSTAIRRYARPDAAEKVAGMLVKAAR